jgi:hypothetical protein
MRPETNEKQSNLLRIRLELRSEFGILLNSIAQRLETRLPLAELLSQRGVCGERVGHVFVGLGGLVMSATHCVPSREMTSNTAERHTGLEIPFVFRWRQFPSAA